VSARPHVALVGTTASGKSALAMAIAQSQPDIEIVSIDSMQVYRGMDIGTAKPSQQDRLDVPHHLLDLADPDEEFTVARFQREFDTALRAIEGRGHRALLVGGTGLYLRAVIDGLALPGRFPDVLGDFDGVATPTLHERLATLDPIAAGRMEPTNRRRVVRALEVTVGSGRPFSSFGPGLEAYPATRFRLLGVRLPAAVIRERIADRYQRQLDHGFVEEVRTLARLPIGLSRTAAMALGYRELLDHVCRGRDLDEAVKAAAGRTRQFARRQRSWFRRDPRIEWLEADVDPMQVLPSLERAIAGQT
jgi:tRNA dimethylallyltransferase